MQNPEKLCFEKDRTRLFELLNRTLEREKQEVIESNIYNLEEALDSI
ncbi:hypothetical protein [Halobacillus massiliensis]|nr:hypothetical protein [Halobacillus massiliensis]